MRHLILIPSLFLVVASCHHGRRESRYEEQQGPDVFDFIRDYRMSRYLALAEHMQNQDFQVRVAELRWLAADPRRSSDLYPLCRMLFQAKEGSEFRRPLLGGACFVGRRNYTDSPFEPITIFKGVPILIVRGYCLAGYPEQPSNYLEYCIENCRWREELFVEVPLETRRRIIEDYLMSQPDAAESAEWFRSQAE